MNLAILVSGSGTNLQALIDAIAADPEFGAEIVVVVSDRPGVKALDRADAAGLPSVVVPYAADRRVFTEQVCVVVKSHGAEALVLAGFMRILSAEAMSRFPNRILNIHPSLLPAFPGTDAIAQALAHGVTVSGVTVHFVDEQVDHGPIIAQRAVPVLEDDDVASLHARIQIEEHDLYPVVVKALAGGRLQVAGRKVVWR